MALKDRVVNIAYALKDRFTGQVGKITAGFRKIESSSDSSSRKIELNNKRATGSFGGLTSALSAVKLGFLAVVAAVAASVSVIGRAISATNVQTRAETKLETTLKNLTGASEAQVQKTRQRPCNNSRGLVMSK